MGGVFTSVLAADMEALAAGAGRKVSRNLSPVTPSALHDHFILCISSVVRAHANVVLHSIMAAVYGKLPGCNRCHAQLWR